VHLHAAFVPPAETLEELTALVRSLEPPTIRPHRVTSHLDTSKRGLFGRPRRPPEPAPEPEPEVPVGPMLQILDAEHMLIPVTDFGWLTPDDARRVFDVLAKVCAGLPPAPTVRVSGGSALVDPDDKSVWANLAASDDELSAMRAISTALVSGIEPLGYYRDRRQFKARLPVATITDATTVEHLERVLATLDMYQGTPWQVSEVTLFRRGSGIWRTLTVGG
jgi:2'-5' RNA ligase